MIGFVLSIIIGFIFYIFIRHFVQLMREGRAQEREIKELLKNIEWHINWMETYSLITNDPSIESVEKTNMLEGMLTELYEYIDKEK